MALVHEETITIKFSKLIRNNESSGVVATKEILDSLQAIAEELVGAGIIVEVEHD